MDITVEDITGQHLLKPLKAPQFRQACLSVNNA
jgi:hypothetical protein